jgi:hypothetical protein
MPVATDIDAISDNVNDSNLCSPSVGTTCRSVSLLDTDASTCSQIFRRSLNSHYQPPHNAIQNKPSARVQRNPNAVNLSERKRHRDCKMNPKQTDAGSQQQNHVREAIVLGQNGTQTDPENTFTGSAIPRKGRYATGKITEIHCMGSSTAKGRSATGKVTKAAGNAGRERCRVQTLRAAFLSLQRHIPSVPRDTKLSRLDVLRLSIAYITELRNMLQQDEAENSKPALLLKVITW